MAHPRAPSENCLPPEPDEILDSGDTGCGELLMQLPAIFRRLAPGAVFGLINTDPGTPEDLPAWCRMTGHAYLGVRHGERPLYLIRRRPD